MDSTVVGGNFSNEPVEVTGKAFEGADEILWLRVTDPNGVEGWIPASAARNSDNLIPTQEELRMKFWFDFAPGTCTDADFEEVVPVVTEAPIATEAPAATEVPMAGLAVLPADLAIEKMVACGDIGKTAKWDASKSPFTGTEFVCGEDKFWDITRMFYEGVEYQIPVTENVSPVAAPEEAEIIDFPVPGNYVSLYTEEGKLKGVTYPLQNEGPHVIPVCNKCTLIIGVGKFTMAGTADIVGFTAFTGLFGASEVTGNIIAGVCSGANGCVDAITGAKAAHIQVTIVFPGYEIPNESAAWAVNFMFNPESSNCGDGCKEVYFGNLNSGEIKKFDKAITAPDLDLVAPEGPYSKINIVVDGTPSGSEDILNDAGDPIGQKYYLADKDAFVSVPEDGGTVFYFGAACTLNGITRNAGDAVVEYGIKTDGGTPHDQNQTVEVICSQPEMVLVHFFHGGNFEEELQKLKNEYPDWNWP